MGEVDVLKSIQLLPGVKSAGEGNTGYYVRGGGPDQNLILLDEAPVYNASHLFGFFSVFNADAIQNVTLTKGGMPAYYGGRLSSVLDIQMKEGNNKKMQVEGESVRCREGLPSRAPSKKTRPHLLFLHAGPSSIFFYRNRLWIANPKPPATIIISTTSMRRLTINFQIKTGFS
jgi:hypothetical protein